MGTIHELISFRRNIISIFYHKFDLPDDIIIKGDIAIDTEAMGLNNHRDRLCVVQISNGNNDAHLIHFPEANYSKSNNLIRILSDKSTAKIFHFARFDVAIIKQYLNILVENIYCTRTASKIARTYTDSHSLKELCRELLNINISKQQQTSDWGAAILTKEQQEYAANDVLHLHKIRELLNIRLMREKRLDLANDCFKFLSTRALLDLYGWDDIFSH